MKVLWVAMACVCSSVYAETRVLPPVIDKSMGASETVVNSSILSNNATYEVLLRLEQLQSELQQLRGTVEEQSQMIDDLKNRQSNIYSDLDLRIQALTDDSISVNNGFNETGKTANKSLPNID